MSNDADLVATESIEVVALYDTETIVVSIGEQGPQGLTGIQGIQGTTGAAGGGPPTPSPIITSEALTSGNYVNVYSEFGAFRVRKASAASIGTEAHGFVANSFSAGALAAVYSVGAINSNLSGQIPGPVFLATTAGLGSSMPPTGIGQIVQRVGFATSNVAVVFQGHAAAIIV